MGLIPRESFGDEVECPILRWAGFQPEPQEPLMTQQQPISPLRRRMIEDMTVRNLSPSTQQSYVYAIANFDDLEARLRSQSE